MSETQWIRKDDYVPQKGDKIVNPSHYSYSTDRYYVVVERENLLTEPTGNVVIRYVSHLPGRASTTLAKANDYGKWFNYTHRDGFDEPGLYWHQFVAANKIEKIDSIYRKEI
jgi:hypothetical protein